MFDKFDDECGDNKSENCIPRPDKHAIFILSAQGRILCDEKTEKLAREVYQFQKSDFIFSDICQVKIYS